MNEFEHKEEKFFEVPNIERLINIPIVNPDEPFVEILTQLKAVRRDGGGKKVSTMIDYQKPRYPISEYISFRDIKFNNAWGVVIYKRPYLELAASVIMHTNAAPELVEKCLRRYFTQREDFHFFVDRAVFGLENLFELHTGTKHNFWKYKTQNRLYKYSSHEITAAEFYSWKMKEHGEDKILNYLIKTHHLSASSTNIDGMYGKHRELNSLVLSDYLKSGCSLDERIVGIEGLLGLDDKGMGGDRSIKLSQTYKREIPTKLPFRFYP
jgi:hypothetical protein